MLAQAVLAHYGSREWRPGRLTVTGISPCPYATYLHYNHLDPDTPDALARLRMKNGNWQEKEILEDLRSAGFQIRFTGKFQLVLHIGQVPITGRPDGLITVNSREDVLSIKAMSLDRFTKFKQKGFEAEPRIKCQEQLYLASEELKDRAGCWIYAKHKDSCRPYDIFEEKDLSYSRPIIEATESIVLGKEEVKRPSEPIPLCSSCRHRLFCWKQELVNTSGIAAISLPEAVRMWLEGQFHLDLGKTLNGDARVLLKQALGDSEILYAEDAEVILSVRKVLQRRSGISMPKFIEEFGPEALSKVLEEKIVEQMRILRVE